MNKAENNLGRVLLCETMLWSKNPAQRERAADIARRLGEGDKEIAGAIEKTKRKLLSGDVIGPEPSGEQGPPM